MGAPVYVRYAVEVAPAEDLVDAAAAGIEFAALTLGSVMEVCAAARGGQLADHAEAPHVQPLTLRFDVPAWETAFREDYVRAGLKSARGARDRRCSWLRRALVRRSRAGEAAGKGTCWLAYHGARWLSAEDRGGRTAKDGEGAGVGASAGTNAG